jgi:hypothetical protein
MHRVYNEVRRQHSEHYVTTFKRSCRNVSHGISTALYGTGLGGLNLLKPSGNFTHDQV